MAEIQNFKELSNNTVSWSFYEHLSNNTWAHDGELFKTRIVFMIQINKCMTTLDCNDDEL